MNALRVYDAAARHLSFTRAADELAVTPAAVGQQIRALEDHLGVVLFRRTSKGLELTPEGCAGLDPLREGFLRFEESVAAMQAGQGSDRYTIAAPREFYAEWLSPRLATFQKGTPGVVYSILANEDADFTEANLDLAIRLVDGPGELEGVQLAEARRVVLGRGRSFWPEPDQARTCMCPQSCKFFGSLAGVDRHDPSADTARSHDRNSVGRAVFGNQHEPVAGAQSGIHEPLGERFDHVAEGAVIETGSVMVDERNMMRRLCTDKVVKPGH